DVEAYYVNANELATELGTAKAANMVMLGAYLELFKPVSLDSVLKAFLEVFGEDKAKLLPLNEKALKAGAEAVRK
ncbi:MAG TPA: 2-oxoacid:ferredoxin oxidoreductase subunit gamma, partial [Clostridiales bacterium]|nr:2-oxoacid:ferredoxin oxidoreductase subunit gamma [Clostridiales bacterium]